MEVILQENVSNLGFVGDVVNVKPGYARNFLIPKKLALPANRANVAQTEHLKKLISVKKAQKKTEATELLKRLEKVSVAVEHAAEGERLFGSVTITEIVEQLVSKGFQIDRHLIRVEAPIRTVGEHVVDIKLHQEVVAKLKVVVTAKAQDA